MRCNLTSRGFGTLCAVAALLIGSIASAAPKRVLVVERAVLVMRHGIRAPLDGEVPLDTRTGAPWPAWPVAESRITPHGVRALERVAAYDRRLLAARGLMTPNGCPAGVVRIRSNSSDRTIASGQAYAEGLAPGCDLAIEHKPLGTADAIFEPLRARGTAFDARAAIASINRETGGMAALARRHGAALARLDQVLGCTSVERGCVPAGTPTVSASADGHDLVLAGPIRAASGIAQVLLLQEVEGLPRESVGWDRADPATIEQLGALHAALFAVYTHPPYMAAHQAAVLGREVLASLSSMGPRLTVFMGHDTNVTALAAALRVDLKAPGYATNDVPPGGALLIERLRDASTGARFVRVSYRTQSPETLRGLGQSASLVALKIPGCASLVCPAATFSRRLVSHLAPLQTAR
ncbi:histidine-type phosphatase [Sphingomonas sp. PP-CC-1A-547]|uniref:histidine-type phosphatase n=1 Tax=Sphingomonas sp. PP-CC-1A-547 TaxID=2135654 RepID=UPI000E7358C2|nr:histidine-type phosphatase [Sphingomonas sp. PP-CC-1A-547]RKE42799.1 4-phytase/acid phosphatase [Sphingomonas sp. PP-CC-1A-547]TCM05587.1 4-phytase/acid phosphatase [Sphingomonas sp. PP-CC-3G-468]